MKNKMLIFGAAFAALVMTAPAQAQGIVGGADHGAREGERAGGPVGAVVGGAVGAVTGGVAGVLGLDQRPRFHDYVTREHRPSYDYQGEVIVGGEMPAEGGVIYYDVPPEYGIQGYKYTTLNDHRVIVDPRTHHIVEIID
jgi:hypothetical protein